MDDWGLQAVVRGYCNTTTTTKSAAANSFSTGEYPGFFFDPSSFVAEEAAAATAGTGASSGSDFFSSAPSSVELDDLWKPFYVSSSYTSQLPFPAVRQSHQQRPPSGLPEAASSHSQPRSKRRKSQQKRVVCHVPVEGQSSSDVWAWRKYGQKPIKGSPYPRGYYRCSSSKGCLARKQVERSRTDPAMLVITYTGEHSHPVPTHRNSLAGSTRQKYSDQNTATTLSTTTPNSETGGGGANGNSGTCLLTTDMSPTTPLTAVMEEASKIQFDDDDHPEMEAASVGETEDSELFLDLDELHDDVFMDGLDDCFSAGFPMWDGSTASIFG